MLSRFRFTLPRGPVTQGAPLPGAPPRGQRTLGCDDEPVDFDVRSSAAAAARWEMRDVLPEVNLTSGDVVWRPLRDLLGADGSEPAFVVEIENDGRAAIRFGDDRFGERPRDGAVFTGTFRIGNGTAGNVGKGTVRHLVAEPCTQAVVNALDRLVERPISNPLPAGGGRDPESLEEVRQRAPAIFRHQQERAVTPEDYARAAERFSGVQRAVATLRWTGSWRTVFLTVDRTGGEAVNEDFERRLREFLARFRLAGHDLEIDSPRPVPLELALTVCLKAEAFRRVVIDDVRAVLGNRDLPDGRRGLFHPDNLTFGQTIYLSQIYAAVQAVPGVASLAITAFRRWGTQSTAELAEGRLSLGRLEIARLDNDPNFPDRGLIHATPEGGR